MEIIELTPASENKREWKRGGYGICGLDEAGSTWFNPTLLGSLAMLVVLSGGAQCQVHEVDGKECLLVPITWAKEASPPLLLLTLISLIAVSGD